MKNINYDLIKLLHSLSDIVWRLERHYIADANEAKCHSVPALEQILDETKKHVQMVRDEIKMRMDAGVFD